MTNTREGRLRGHKRTRNVMAARHGAFVGRRWGSCRSWRGCGEGEAKGTKGWTQAEAQAETEASSRNGLEREGSHQM